MGAHRDSATPARRLQRLVQCQARVPGADAGRSRQPALDIPRGKFEGYLSQAQARYGVAQAYRALGVRLDEARALREFLQLHPRSLRAPLAAARLRVLDTR